MNIDATDLILGRMAAYAAKQALLGETVNIVNVEKAVVTGKNKRIIEDYKQERERGVPLKGPYYPRTPEMIVKRAIRGMLPHKSARGREALKRIKCYAGIPEEFKDAKFEKVNGASTEKTHARYITIARISKELGGKVQ